MSEEYGKLDLDTLFHNVTDTGNFVTTANYNFYTSMPSTSFPSAYPYNVTTAPNTNYTFNSPSANPSIKCQGDIECDGEITVKGRNLSEVLDNIEKRLAILVPDPAKLEKFEALKKAYDNYKTLEALCQLNEEPDENK